MKRMISLLLSLALLLCLPACAHHVDAPKEPVQFYYPWHTDQLQYGDPQGVITHELREAAGYTDRYSYLLNLYLRGPVTQGLRDPLPQRHLRDLPGDGRQLCRAGFVGFLRSAVRHGPDHGLRLPDPYAPQPHRH